MIIPVLADILNATEKEKVKRIILASFRVNHVFIYTKTINKKKQKNCLFKNLLEKPKLPEIVKANCLCMLQSKVKKLVDLMKQSNIEDPDIVEDIDFLEKKLEGLMIDVSSFDEYTLEITTNRLSWSPVHKSDKFWRENAQRLNENNFFLIRRVF